jgi:hypothetical protein
MELSELQTLVFDETGTIELIKDSPNFGFSNWKPTSAIDWVTFFQENYESFN